MARTVITAFVLANDTRVRVAGALDKNDEGTIAFVAGGKVYDNAKYDNSWHTFPAGTKFEVAALIDKTDSYCLLAKERITSIVTDDEGNEKKVTKTETNGVFLRRMAYEKLLKNVEAVEEAPPAEPDIDFGTPAKDVVVEPPKAEDTEPDADDAVLDELVSEIDAEDAIEADGPSDEELAEIEAEMVA